MGSVEVEAGGLSSAPSPAADRVGEPHPGPLCPRAVIQSRAGQPRDLWPVARVAMTQTSSRLSENPGHLSTHGCICRLSPTRESRGCHREPLKAHAAPSLSVTKGPTVSQDSRSPHVSGH